MFMFRHVAVFYSHCMVWRKTRFCLISLVNSLTFPMSAHVGVGVREIPVYCAGFTCDEVHPFTFSLLISLSDTNVWINISPPSGQGLKHFPHILDTLSPRAGTFRKTTAASGSRHITDWWVMKSLWIPSVQSCHIEGSVYSHSSALFSSPERSEGSTHIRGPVEGTCCDWASCITSLTFACVQHYPVRVAQIHLTKALKEHLSC